MKNIPLDCPQVGDEVVVKKTPKTENLKIVGATGVVVGEYFLNHKDMLLVQIYEQPDLFFGHGPLLLEKGEVRKINKT